MMIQSQHKLGCKHSCLFLTAPYCADKSIMPTIVRKANTLSYLMNSRLTARDQTAPDDKQHLLQPPGQEWPTLELVN